jgi:cholesterol transport system auxiliary component
MRLNQSTAVLLLAIALSGCALLPGGGPPPIDTFNLSAPDAGASGQRRHVQVLIAEPGALKALDGQNIVISTSPGSIAFLKGAQWADRLPVVIQTRLAEAFQSSGGFTGVGTPGEGLAIDYQVVADIRAFQVGVNGARNADVEIYVRLVDDRNGEVRASKVFRASAPVSGEGNAGYVRALDAAFGQVGAEIVNWTEGRV